MTEQKQLAFTWDAENFEWTNERGQTPWEEKIERELAQPAAVGGGHPTPPSEEQRLTLPQCPIIKVPFADGGTSGHVEQHECGRYASNIWPCDKCSSHPGDMTNESVRHFCEPERTFYRYEDGHTYWQVDGAWLGAPTLKDGSPDVENAGYVSDFDLSADEIRALVSYLDRRAGA